MVIEIIYMYSTKIVIYASGLLVLPAKVKIKNSTSSSYSRLYGTWNHFLYSKAKKRLKIGYYTDDGYFPLTPACKRAVEVAIEALDGAGCEIVYFKPPHLETMINFFFDHILADGGANSLEMWEGEILDQVIWIESFVTNKYATRWRHRSLQKVRKKHSKGAIASDHL